MNRTGFAILIGAWVVGAGLLAGPFAWSQPAFLPGLTTTDEWPNGCVSCHKAGSDGDTRLTVLLAAKKHPNIAAMVRTVPDGCMVCHKEGGQAGPLNKQTHRIHYANPGSNKFITVDHGSCLACHTLDVKTGIIKLKSGPKNW
jgi:hypothetical protein